MKNGECRWRRLRLGYQWNLIARAFSRRRTNTLEIIVPSFSRYFVLEVLRGVHEALADTDYSVVIRAIERAEEQARVLYACCRPNRADGALFLSISPDAALTERLLGHGVPVVLIDAVHPQFASVSVDHAQGEARAVQHCIELGLAVLPGYERMAELALPAGARIAADLLGLPDSPTAILTGGDMHAVGVLELARGMQLRAGQDLTLVGYNDIALAQHFGLTTVRCRCVSWGIRQRRCWSQWSSAPQSDH